MITFNWTYKNSSAFYLLTFTFHPDEKPFDNVWKQKKTDNITWAPTHQEQGYIAELLGLANQINGLSIGKREKLRAVIDKNAEEDFEFKLTEDNIRRVITAFKEVEGIYLFQT
jgi:hypothetical protein